jgi:hypothetical protein
MMKKGCYHVGDVRDTPISLRERLAGRLFGSWLLDLQTLGRPATSSLGILLPGSLRRKQEQLHHPHQVVGRRQFRSQLVTGYSNVPYLPVSSTIFSQQKISSTRFRTRWLTAYPGCLVISPSMALRRPEVFWAT